MKAFFLAFLLCFGTAAMLPEYAHAEEKTVYVTPTGKKFHIKNCRTLTKSKKVTEISKTKATEQGYTACKVCRP